MIFGGIFCVEHARLSSAPPAYGPSGDRLALPLGTLAGLGIAVAIERVAEALLAEEEAQRIVPRRAAASTSVNRDVYSYNCD